MTRHDTWYDLYDPYDLADPDDRPARRGHPRRRTTTSDLEGPAPHDAPSDGAQADGRLPDGATFSSWFGAEHGPQPRPAWVVTDHNALDTELGVLKTGKEADVHLVERRLPATGEVSLLAAKRYRSSEHRQFHRDAGYLEGRRVKESREMRAIETRTDYGRTLIAGQWSRAEFVALSRLWVLGCADGGIHVPYPVQLSGTELLMEFVGTPDGVAAPRLAALRPAGDELVDLWQQLLDALTTMAQAGYAHGDLSAYNLLVHDGRLVLIDLPQIVDVVGNPQGPQFLARDVANVAAWFVGKGLPEHLADVGGITAQLLADAGLA